MRNITQQTFNLGKVKGENGQDGRGIVNIIPPDKPGLPGQRDIYTIKYTDNTESRFPVYNGIDGNSGITESEVTLFANGWSNNQQIVRAPIFFPTGRAYIVSPKDDSFLPANENVVYAEDVVANGIMLFKCVTVPQVDLIFSIINIPTKGGV